MFQTGVFPKAFLARLGNLRREVGGGGPVSLVMVTSVWFLRNRGLFIYLFFPTLCCVCWHSHKVGFSDFLG